MCVLWQTAVRLLWIMCPLRSINFHHGLKFPLFAIKLESPEVLFLHILFEKNLILFLVSFTNDLIKGKQVVYRKDGFEMS